MVLLVDDEACILEEYSELLDLDGIPCSVETSPIRAIDHILENPSIRVLVTDLRMPELNGMELIRILQERLPPTRPMRYIILSGYIESLDAIRAIGDVHLLAKPIDADDLSEAITQGLDG